MLTITPNVTKLIGTTNQILLSPTSGIGVVTVSTPQDIATSSTPSFQRLILSGSTANKFIDANGTMDNATGDETAYSLQYAVNKATSGNTTGLLIAGLYTSAPGTNLFIDLQNAGFSKFSIDSGGNLITSATTFTFNTITSLTFLNVLSQPLIYIDSTVIQLKTLPVVIDTNVTVPQVYGSSASGGGLLINSTSNAIKGSISVGGTVTIDEVNNVVGINNAPAVAAAVTIAKTTSTLNTVRGVNFTCGSSTSGSPTEVTGALSSASYTGSGTVQTLQGFQLTAAAGGGSFLGVPSATGKATNIYGAQIVAGINSITTGSMSRLIGGLFLCKNHGPINISNFYGGLFGLEQADPGAFGGQAVTNMYMGRFTFTNGASSSYLVTSGSVTNMYGLYIDAAVNSAGCTITNYSQLYLQASGDTVSGQKSIYQAETTGTENRFCAPLNMFGADQTPTSLVHLMNGDLQLDNNNNTAAKLVFFEPSTSGTNKTTFAAQAQAADIAYLLPSAQGAASTFLQNNGSGTLSWVAPAASAPTTATYLTLSNDATLTAERVLTAGTGVTFTDGGANSTLTVAIGQAVGTGNSPTFANETLTGKITTYNNIATVSGGVPSELATVDLATQSAAISATTLYTPAATGLFRISIYLQLTRAATTSSRLAGSSGVVITYTDGDGSVAQSNVALLQRNDGSAVTSDAGNVTNVNLTGSMVIYAKTGVAIQYAIGYTSSGVTSMQYAAHLKIEAM